MSKSLVYLALVLAVIIGLGTTGAPAQAQGPVISSSLETTLAQAAAKSFLVTLTRPELASTRDFYLHDDLKNSPVLAALQAEPVTSFQITHAAWLDDNTYQVQATLQPGSRALTLHTAKFAGRWQIASLELAHPNPASPTASQTAPAPAANPQPTTGLSGRLVFQTRSGGDIYVINANGAGLRRLTAGLDPQLSPDGSQVAFTRWEPRYELFTINLDGSAQQSWAQGWRQMKSPTWSADGAHLIFSFQSGGRLQDEKRHVDLAQAARDQDGVDIPPQARDVELDGDTLRYRLPMDAHWYLQQVDLATGAYLDLPTGQYAYSPTGHPTNPNLLLYTAGGSGIALYDAAANTTRPVTTDPNDRAPALSPDGSRVAVSYQQDGHWEIHTFNLDGSQRQRLTTTPLSVLVDRTRPTAEFVDGKERLVAPEQPFWNNAAPAWSPDGRQIAFMTDRTGQWEIWVMNADGSNQRPMFPNGALQGLTFEYAGVDEHMLSWR